MKDSAVLLIDCPDQKGLVARVSSLLYRHGANILHADQHQDHDLGLFFMRVEWALDGPANGPAGQPPEPVSGPEARVNCRKLHEATYQQTGAHGQDHHHGDLGGDQHL